MNFLETIFTRLHAAADRAVLAESRAGGASTVAGAGVTGAALLAQIEAARAFLRSCGLHAGDRCALAAHNSIRWVALDLAVLSEGLIAVPLYARQAPGELVAMMRDAGVSLIFCGDPALRDAIAKAWPDAPRTVLFEEIFGDVLANVTTAGSPTRVPSPPAMPRALSPESIVAILYTSGTSGESKGVPLAAGNIDHLLSCTKVRLDQLMGHGKAPSRASQDATEHVFHYLPFCFAGSWILLLSCLSRTSLLTLSMDLTKLVDEIREAGPHYFLNVPTLLERMRAGIEADVQQRGGALATIFKRARAAWSEREEHQPGLLGRFWLWAAGMLIFPPIRKRLGPNLRALICGSAPLARETQSFFAMMGIPVLQVYGLTETTAICTMDDPAHIEPGRVGPAIPGIEMKLGENSEIMVRGPNIFPGYWKRPAQTAEVLRDGWFQTGDQGDVDANGNWRISGRLKNLIILNSGHNVPPEPLEESLLRAIAGAQQVVLVGNGRGFLAAIVTGESARAEIESQIEQLNGTLPHYRKVRMFHVEPQPFTIENGLLTANGKLKRDAIAAKFAKEIDQMYAKGAHSS